MNAQAINRGSQALRGNPWFNGFPAAAIDELAQAGYPRSFGHGEYLARRGERVAGAAVILSGGVRNGTLSPDGHEFTFSLLKPGAVIWLVAAFDGSGTINDAIAYGKTEVWIIPREAFARMLEQRPEFYSHFVKMLCYRMRKAHSIIDDLALMPVSQRLARQICTLATAGQQAAASQVEIQLDVTQHDLAALLGVTRPIVNRALKKLEGEGLIRTRYHRLVVCDLQALRSRCADNELFTL